MRSIKRAGRSCHVMSALVCGLDVHKDSTYATILSPEGKIVNQTRMENERILLARADATLNIAKDTTFDHGEIYTCTWMNNNYNTSSLIYWNRAGETLNIAVNALTDVLHTLYISSDQSTPSPTPTSSPSSTASPSPIPTPSQTQTTSPSSTSLPTQQPRVNPTSNPTVTPSQTTNPISTPSVLELTPLMLVIVIIFVSKLSIMVKKRTIVN